MKKDRKAIEDAASEQGNGVENIIPANDGKDINKGADFKSVKPSTNVGEISEIEPTKEKTKTEAAAEAVLGSSGSGGSVGSSPLLRGVSFGGGADEGKFGKDVSATTKADNVYRSGSRIGKREDPITRKIDFNYPELFKVAIKQSKPLSETSERQGYNGNYADEHAYTNKVSGGAPADPLFNRSVDFIGLDMNYFGSGQYNVAKNQDLREYKAKSYNPSTKDYSTLSLAKGSYMPKELVVTINDKGAVGLEFKEDDISNRDLADDEVRLAADHSIRQLNRLELDRLTMVSKAGNESDASWSCLGDAIVTATAWNHILKDTDILAGNNIFMSKRKLNEALAFQVNKAAKDGVRVKGPMAEMLNGNIEGSYSSALKPVSESNGISYAFNSNVYAAGGAGLWLAINDSLPKYNTKGKLLTLPLSFKNAIKVCDANDGEFRVRDEFYKDVCHAELFSTIDGPYCPVNPIVLTDKANVTNSMSLAATGNVVIDGSTEPEDNEVAPIGVIHYENIRNKYDIKVYNFFVQGLHDYFKANASRLYTNLPTPVSGTVKTLVVPIQSSTTSLSLWDLFVCSAVPFMVPRRQKSLVEVIKYQNNFGYPYTGSTPLKEVDVNYALNYTFNGTDAGLNSKICNPVDAIKVKFPEVFWTVSATKYTDHYADFGFVKTKTVLPHYFVQNNFKERASDKDGYDRVLRLSDNPSNIAYPSTRTGVMLSDMDTIYGMSEEDYRLALDRMITYPAYDRIKSFTELVTDGSDIVAVDYITEGSNHGEVEASETYKYGMTGDGIPAIPYIASVQLKGNDPTTDAARKQRCLTIKDVMKTPRELGLHFVVPAGVLTPIDNVTTAGGVTTHTANFRSTDSGYLAVSGPGFTAYIYKIQGKSCENAILNNADYVIEQSEAYKNDYCVYQATPNNVQEDFGFVLSISKDMKRTATAHTFTLDSGRFDFIPFTENSFGDIEYSADLGTFDALESQSEDVTLNVIGFQKYFWSRLQRLPFVVNPFDANGSDLLYASISGTYPGNKYDIYDFMYFFGFCGFRASDFQELTYERNKMRISLGMNYINDPYIDKTLLLK